MKRRTFNPGITGSGVSTDVRAWSRGTQARVRKRMSFVEVMCMLRPTKGPGNSHMGDFPNPIKCLRDVP